MRTQLSLSLDLSKRKEDGRSKSPRNCCCHYLQRADELQKHDPLVAYYGKSLSLSLSPFPCKPYGPVPISNSLN